jgi:putative redox protein
MALLKQTKEKTMVKIEIDYEGELRCHSVHISSGGTLTTDAPLDNQGRGEGFSPTDLVATAYGTCMATIMGIVAKSRKTSLSGLKLSVTKEMSSDLPRRIVGLAIEIHMPLAEDHVDSKTLKEAALNCPVRHSIHPEIDVSIAWYWA